MQNVSDSGNEKIDFYNNNIFRENINFTFNLTNVQNINNIIHSIKTTSCGTDDISINMIKYCSPFIDIYILHIINSCIELHYFPDAWKVAIGKPLAKNNNPKTFSDLRIISILPVLSKILERILHDQIYSYFTENNLLPDNQCGFRKNFKTATALTTV